MRSRTRGVSRLVPRRGICFERALIEEVRVKSWPESDSVKKANSGSSRYWASSERRVVVGWASRVEPCWKDIVEVVDVSGGKYGEEGEVVV